MGRLIVPTTVAWFLILIFLTVGLYDAWAAMYKPREYTVSFALLAIAREFPIIAIVVGIIIGHLFFPQLPASRIINGHETEIVPSSVSQEGRE